MTKTKLIIFILLNFFWLFITFGVIYTVYIFTINESQIIGPAPIGIPFINFQFIMVMLLVLFSNILFYIVKDESLCITRKIFFYVTSLCPSALIIFTWLIRFDRFWPREYINYFGLYQVWTHGVTSWTILLIFVVLCIFSFLNILLKKKHTHI